MMKNYIRETVTRRQRIDIEYIFYSRPGHEKKGRLIKPVFLVVCGHTHTPKNQQESELSSHISDDGRTLNLFCVNSYQ